MFIARILVSAGLTAFTTNYGHISTTVTLAHLSHLAQYIDTLFNIFQKSKITKEQAGMETDKVQK